MEASKIQVTDMVGKWLLLEAQYRDSQINMINFSNEHSLYEHEEIIEMNKRAAEKQRDFETSIQELFGKHTLDVIRQKGGELVRAIVKGA